MSHKIRSLYLNRANSRAAPMTGARRWSPCKHGNFGATGGAVAESCEPDRGCDEARTFIRFLAFGLTLRFGGLTVTVRNRHCQLSLARGP
jgi:hypothetical protein